MTSDNETAYVRAVFCSHTPRVDGLSPEEYFDAWRNGQDAAAIDRWADFQDSVLTGPLAYAVEDSDLAEVARWTSAARAYAAGLRSGPGHSA